MFRMRDQVSKVAIIRQKQQTLGIVIEPSNRIDPNLDAFQKILHCGPTFGVGHGGHEARGLIQHDIGERLLWVDELAVHLDVVFGCVCLAAKFGHYGAVHAHPAFRDKLFCSAARGQACGCYYFLKPF
jgi:hypothetical protein